MQTVTFRVDKQWGPAVQHQKLHPISWVRTFCTTVEHVDPVHVSGYDYNGPCHAMAEGTENMAKKFAHWFSKGGS